MKKKLSLLSILLFIIANPSFGQTHSLSVILEPSIATSLIEDQQIRTYDPIFHIYEDRLTYSAGIEYIYLSKSKTKGMRTGLFMNSFGFKFRATNNDPLKENEIFKLYAHTISMPLSVNICFQSLAFHGGPVLNYTYNLTGKTGNGEPAEVYADLDFSWGIKGGADYSFPLSNDYFLKAGLYVQSFYAFEKVFINYGLSIGLGFQL